MEVGVQSARHRYLLCGTGPSQRALNEDSDDLLRKDGLPKEMGFNQIDQAFVSTVADKRNNIPRKSLNYRTPLEAFMSQLNGVDLSSLN
ncbi:Integrase [Planococcus antarcticus DSM 14505]|uniref:Integrase n=1 Tax=Planococcus antarcticus DSM 14505 TaxID=1185653 RepID=A0A1C7DI71_9BACL|nr:transposase [Planococcus antarcticus DSM 14505]EIM05116.1 Integrase [Planococcus antarcticus DSM 14505]